LFVGVFCGAAAASSALAQEAAVTIDSSSPTLEKQESGWSTTIGLTNLTSEAIKLHVTPPQNAGDGCRVTPEVLSLRKAEHQEFPLSISDGCSFGKQGFTVKLETERVTPAQSVAVTAVEKPTPSPNWHALWVFVWLLILLLVIPAVGICKGFRFLGKSLEYLDATWSFGDSWVTNITAAGGLLTGIFGSTEVVTALLGKDAKSSVALATVGAAIALALIAMGPLVLGATKSKDNKFNTVGGLLAASVVTLMGAFGELWVLLRSGEELSLGGWEDRIVIVAILAGLLLLAYAVRSVIATIDDGLHHPPAPPEPDTIQAAKLVAAALGAQHGGGAPLAEAEKKLRTHLKQREQRRRPRRSALL
jgi:hypothetical protein